jgi:hypothetical protein
MNVRLLKKIHKRYDWYFRKDGVPVVIDHLNKALILLDDDHSMMRPYKNKEVQEPECGIKIYRMRMLISVVVGERLLNRSIYKQGVRNRNKKLAVKNGSRT